MATGVGTGFVAFSRPTTGEGEIAEVVGSLRSGWFTSAPKVQRFEQAFCERLGAAHAVAVNSATAGLHVALAALDIGRNEFMLALQEENVGTGLHFPALHLSPYYRRKCGHREGDLPHAEAAGESIISLPLYPLLSQQDQVRVCAQHGRA